MRLLYNRLDNCILIHSPRAVSHRQVEKNLAQTIDNFASCFGLIGSLTSTAINYFALTGTAFRHHADDRADSYRNGAT